MIDMYEKKTDDRLYVYYLLNNIFVIYSEINAFRSYCFTSDNFWYWLMKYENTPS